VTFPTPDSLHAWATIARFLAFNNTDDVGTPPLPKYYKYNYHASMNLFAPLANETTHTHGLERTEEVGMTTDAVHPTLSNGTATRHLARVESILNGETSVAEAGGKHGMIPAEV